MNLFQLLASFIVFLCCAPRSDKLRSCLSAEKAENDEIAAQQILAHVAVHICMCVPCQSTKITFMLHVCGLEALIVSFLREPISKLAPYPPAQVTFGPGGAWSPPDHCVHTYFAEEVLLWHLLVEEVLLHFLIMHVYVGHYNANMESLFQNRDLIIIIQA